ncbi:MAG TPA: metallophosphatase domain-containing protein [Candidatus Omnitrophota bacterium]|nr:metallophosphatase domain-containing protein [Candidatus Omnitrophota bacterium]
MRIVSLSDTHTQHRKVEVPEGDVLIFAGDGEFRSALDLIDFNNWLALLKHKTIIVIAGNHDFVCERRPNDVRKYLTKAVYLKDEPYVLPNGMILWGSPMTKTFLNWAFMESDEDLDQYYWSKIPKDTDILLTHGPAYKHLDTAAPVGEHLGSKTLAKKVKELRIPYVICGHIHGSYGIEKTEKTTYINCSVLDEEYHLVNKPIVIDV